MSTAPVTTVPTAQSAPAATPVQTWHIHFFYIVIALLAWYGTHTWLQEHDARVAAENSLKATQNQIMSLQDQIKARDAQSAQQQQVIVKVIHDTVTPAQVVAAIPQITEQPLPKPITLDAQQDMVIPAPDVLPIFDQLANEKLEKLQLATCTSDLADEKTIVTAQTTEITILKKKPAFWKRVKHDAKVVGIGVGIGALVVLIH